MTVIRWLGGNGNWSTAADWSGGGVPGAADDVSISTSAPSEVTVTNTETAHSLAINDGAALEIGAHDQGAGTLSLTGSLSIAGGAEMYIGSYGDQGVAAVQENVTLAGGAELFVGNYEGAGALTIGGNLALDSEAAVGIDTSGVVTVGGNLALNPEAASLQLYGALTVDGAVSVRGGDFVVDGGVLTLSGVLRITGGTFDFNSGIINGGVISKAGGVVQWGTGTLNGVTCYGSMDVRGRLSIIGKGLTLAGVGGQGPDVVNLISGVLDLQGAQTLDNATINMSAGGGSPAVIDTSGADGALTLGAHLVIDVKAAASISGGADDSVTSRGVVNVLTHGALTVGSDQGTLNFVNLGTMTVARGASIFFQDANFTNAAGAVITGEAGSQLTFGAAGGTWSNAGTLLADHATVTFDGARAGATGVIDVDNSTVDFNSDLTTADLAPFGYRNNSIYIGATLDNTGAVLTIGAGSGFQTVIIRGAISGGTIVDMGAGVIWGGTLDGVTIDGTLDLSNGGTTTVTDKGLILKGVGGVGPGLADVQGAQLLFQGTQTLDNATIAIGDGAVYADDTNGAGAMLTLGANLTITQTGLTAQLSSEDDLRQNPKDAIINLGAIDATFSAGTFSINPLNFTNRGTITIANGDTLELNPGDFTNLVHGVLTGGAYDVEAGSMLQLANNLEVTRDNATIILSGANSIIESLDTQTARQVTIDSSLTSIAASGVLEILDGRDFTSTNAIGNIGSLILGGGAFTTGRLYDAVGSTLQGYGAVTSIFIDHGDVVSTGVLSFSGDGDTFSGTMSGAEIAFSGGRDTLLTGATLTSASWSMDGGARAAVGENLSYAGTVSETSSTIIIFSGDTLSLTGAATFAGGLTVGGPGSLALLQATFNGANVISALTVDTGSIDVASGSLAFRRALNGAGVLQIGSGAVAEVDAAASSTLVADFAGNGATLALGLANVFRSTIRGFAGGDTIDLIDTTATSATLKAGDKLVIVNGAKIIATLSLSGNYSGDTFNVTSDGHGGSEITLATQAKAEAGPGVALFAQQLSAFAPQGATKLALSGAIPHLAAPAHLAQPRFQP